MKKPTARKQILYRKWYITDATDKILGRFATELAVRLRGKHKTIYTPHIDHGDYIIVLNASNVKISGKKFTDKIYYRHSGYIGGLKKISFKDMITKCPERVIEIAVRGMLPKGSLGRSIFSKLKVYAGTKHNHLAQQPQFINIG